MRRFLGVLTALAGVFLVYEFAAEGVYRTGPEYRYLGVLAPFGRLGQNYPYDVGMLMAAVWCTGLTLTFLICSRRPTETQPGYVSSSEPGSDRGGSSSMTGFFLLNALLLVTSLLVAYAGTWAPGNPSRTIAVFSAVAALQTAAGLILLILALFDKRKRVGGLILGTSVYVAATAIEVLVFLRGQPAT
ncbi:MAG: hypothetical protein HYY16_04000 [Planctomycetes bacterium]|nr:hypothetical protein [Planctomycetota bacterium]